MTATQSPVAIITGGATGIGFGIAEALVQAGYRVAIGSRRKDVVDEAASRLQSLKKGQVIGLPLDVTDRTSVWHLYTTDSVYESSGVYASWLYMMYKMK